MDNKAKETTKELKCGKRLKKLCNLITLTEYGLVLLCHECKSHCACPSDEELEAMQLAADEEQTERDAYFAAHGMGCEWEAHDDHSTDNSR